MSRFLAPIHFWLFNKIKYHERLEDEIVSAFAEKYGDEVFEIERKSAEKYGEKTSEEDLESVIDLQNIHGWLQKRIGEAELRQADIIASLLEKYGGDGLKLLEDIHRKVGGQYGATARESSGNVGPDQLYKVLNDYILDGMPCDNVRKVVQNDENTLSYAQVQCLHLPYWNEAGLDEDVMYSLRAAWIESFVEALSPEHGYEFNRTEIGGKSGQSHRIFKK